MRGWRCRTSRCPCRAVVSVSRSRPRCSPWRASSSSTRPCPASSKRRSWANHSSSVLRDLSRMASTAPSFDTSLVQTEWCRSIFHLEDELPKFIARDKPVQLLLRTFHQPIERHHHLPKQFSHRVTLQYR